MFTMLQCVKENFGQIQTSMYDSLYSEKRWKMIITKPLIESLHYWLLESIFHYTVHMLYSLIGFEATESKNMVDKKSMAKKLSFVD